MAKHFQGGWGRPFVGEAWAICPVCGKTLAVQPVASPGEPVAMVEHLAHHRENTSGLPHHGEAPPATPAAASASLRERRTSAAPHVPRRGSGRRPHGRPDRGASTTSRFVGRK